MLTRMSESCSSCKSTRLEPALLATAIVLERASGWKKATQAARVSCRVCLDCGVIDRFSTDPAKLAKMTEPA